MSAENTRRKKKETAYLGGYIQKNTENKTNNLC